MPGVALHPPLPLPRGWPRCVRSAGVHAISLADLALTRTLVWAADSLNPRLRIQAELERLQREISLLREEIRIKDARMEEIVPHRRPYYPPTARLAIIELRQAGGLLRCGGPWPTHWRTAQKASFPGMSGNPAGGLPLVNDPPRNLRRCESEPVV